MREERERERGVTSATLTTQSRENVLSTVADSSAADSETREPGATANPRHVHGTLSHRVLPRAQTLYHLQPRVPRRRLPHLLQWNRQLSALEHKLRYSKMRQRLRSPIVFNLITLRELFYRFFIAFLPFFFLSFFLSLPLFSSPLSSSLLSPLSPLSSILLATI